MEVVVHCTAAVSKEEAVISQIDGGAKRRMDAYVDRVAAESKVLYTGFCEESIEFAREKCIDRRLLEDDVCCPWF
jgi:hypothetical protein